MSVISVRGPHLFLDHFWDYTPKKKFACAKRILYFELAPTNLSTVCYFECYIIYGFLINPDPMMSLELLLSGSIPR